MDVDGHCLSSQPIVFEVTNNKHLTELQLKQPCFSSNQAFVLRVKEGQVMNISLINLEKSLINNEIYGTIKDKTATKEVVFGSGPREKHLVESSSNEIELKLSHDHNQHSRFMLFMTGNHIWLNSFE